jgi:hypothetical protein
VEDGFNKWGALSFPVLEIVEMCDCSFQNSSIAAMCEKSMIDFSNTTTAWGW